MGHKAFSIQLPRNSIGISMRNASYLPRLWSSGSEQPQRAYPKKYVFRTGFLVLTPGLPWRGNQTSAWSKNSPFRTYQNKHCSLSWFHLRQSITRIYFQRRKMPTLPLFRFCCLILGCARKESIIFGIRNKIILCD